jgi:phosphoenolpyruvate carboxylase
LLIPALIRNVEIGLAKSDLAIARLYSELVENSKLRTRTFDLIREEFDRTLRAVLRVTRQSALLETNPVLSRSIRLRNPYVDPMSLVQVELLRRKHAGEDTPELNDALATTIKGISAGLATRADCGSAKFVSHGVKSRHARHGRHLSHLNHLVGAPAL